MIMVKKDDSSDGRSILVSENTLMLTDNGYYNIKELCDKNVNYLNINGGYTNGYAKYNSISKPIIIDTTGNHEFTFHENGISTNLGIIDYSNLKNIKNNISVPSVPYIGRSYFGDYGDEDDGFMVGWLMGDGWISKRKNRKHRSFYFIYYADDIESRINIKLFNILNKYRDKNEIKKPKLPNKVERCSQILDEKFYDMGFHDGYKKEDGFLEIMNDKSISFTRGFVDGLFSSDGTVSLDNRKNGSSRKIISLSSKFKKPIEDMSLLLSKYGIRSSIYHRRRELDLQNKGFKTYNESRLFINDYESYNIFRDNFNLSHEKKQKRLISQNIISKPIDGYNIKKYRKGNSTRFYKLTLVDSNGIIINNCCI